MAHTLGPGPLPRLRRRARPAVRRPARPGRAPTPRRARGRPGLRTGQPDARCSPSAGPARRCSAWTRPPRWWRGHRPGRGLRFEVGDLRTWRPDSPVDVLVSNATLQWVPGHLDLLPRLWSPRSRPAAGSPSRCPGTSTSPATRSAATSPPRRPSPSTSREWPRRTPTTRGPTSTALAGLGCDVDAWETTYLHVLRGEDPVFTWVSGTGARPTLQALPEDLRERVHRRVQVPAPRGLPARVVRDRAAVPPGVRGRAGVRTRSLTRRSCMRIHHVQVSCPAGRRGRGAPVLP